MTPTLQSDVLVIGAGPAGLMAADVLSEAGVSVTILDAMPSAGRKFLMAGKGGMNITHAEPFDDFLLRYGSKAPLLEPMLRTFTPEVLRDWLQRLGIATFVGSSGRVFPVDMKAAPLLRAWIHRLRSRGVLMQMRHRWLGWQGEALLFHTPAGPRCLQARAVVLALGGASWPQLGSTAEWVPYLEGQGIPIAALKPANCGFECTWTEYFRQRYVAQPLKTVCLSLVDNHGYRHSQRGELMISDYGLEGGLIYALSAVIRDQIEQTGSAFIELDLLPDWSLDKILVRLNKPQGKQSFSSYLRKVLGVEGVKLALVREVLTQAEIAQPALLATTLKALPLHLLAARPIAEAISSAGGVSFKALTSELMLKELPGVFCAGEMLDWEAPTGGYLLTACFATGRKAGQGVLTWLKTNADSS